MTYHRINRRQLLYIESLAKQTGTKLPEHYQGYSSTHAAELIRQLENQLDKQDAEQDKPEQTSLL